MSQMTNFTWKKTRKLQTESSKHFTNDDNNNNNDDDDDNWLTPSKLLKLVMLEDNDSASKRLQQQGVTMAENERSMVKAVS